MVKFKTNEEYIKELSDRDIKLTPLEPYINVSTKILHQCNRCGFKWNITPYYVLDNPNRCPICNHKRVGQPPEYRNSIWANETLRNKLSVYLSDDIMKQHTVYSKQFVNVECPDCHRVRSIGVGQLTQQGFSCICNDGVSFPNKFVFNVLTQLGVRFKTEWAPTWSLGKIYDDYLFDFNMIIENHGIQHYETRTIFAERTLEEEQNNDIQKLRLAQENNIKHYIVLDCRHSTLEWIKDSIMHSKLPQLLNFNAEDINWNCALEFASKNLIREAALLWNQGEDINKIAIILGKSRVTIRKWLKVAAELEWCNYDPQHSKKYGLSFGKNASQKQVLCVELNRVFSSATEAAIFINHKSCSHVAACCRGQREIAGGYHWQYIT